MDDEQKARYVCRVLTSVLSTNEQKLEKGAERRDEVYAAIARGEVPEGYRADWLRDSAFEIIEYLKMLAADFNEQFPDDRASIQDMLDILATAMGHIKKKAGLD